MLRDRGGGDPECERDLVVLLPGRDVLEDLPLARCQPLDARVALVEHEHVQAARASDPQVQAAIGPGELELAASEQVLGYASVLDPEIALQ